MSGGLTYQHIVCMMDPTVLTLWPYGTVLLALLGGVYCLLQFDTVGVSACLRRRSFTLLLKRG